MDSKTLASRVQMKWNKQTNKQTNKQNILP